MREEKMEKPRRKIGKTTIMLILIGVLTLSLNIQVYKGLPQVSKAESHPPTDNEERVKIVEHNITRSELEKLKLTEGVRQRGEDYNQRISGHGTGLRPPTEEEWQRIAEQISVVDSITWSYPILSSPSFVDNSENSWFPPIGNQDGEGSCVTWAVGYYMKTFQEAKEHDWNLSAAAWEGGYEGHPTPEYQNRIISPDFIYHQINGGQDGGSYYSDAISLICSVGASSWEKMPYDPHNSTSWPSEEAWREAPLYRGNSSGFEQLMLTTDDGLLNLKNWLASDHLAVISVDGGQYSHLTSGDVWTLDTYANPVRNHANTIVAYDDNLAYIEQGTTHYGAFKIANSWGVGGWENIPDGFFWISYKAMKQRVSYCMFYRDRVNYEPTLVASFEIGHSNRGACDIAFGIGNKSDPSQTKDFSPWIMDGGNHPFCPNNIIMDITEFGEAAPTVLNQSFFMSVFDRGIPAAHSGTHEWYSNSTSYSWFRLGRNFSIPATGAMLRFWTYYEIEETWDWGYVEAHDLSTNQWYTLPGIKTISYLQVPVDNPNCPYQYEPSTYYGAGKWYALTGSSNGTYQEEMNLTRFAGHAIELYFTYWTDPYAEELGWYVDDVEIPEIGFFDDVESGSNGWSANPGWHITVPTSITGTVLSFSVEYYQNYTSGVLTAKSVSHEVPVSTVTQDYAFAEVTLKNVWIVDDDGPADFSGVQDAINEAISGNTVYVKAGNYFENVVVNKTLLLIGEGGETTIVDGNGSWAVVQIVADNVTITGFTIRGAGDRCVEIYSCSNGILSENVITNSTHSGVHIDSSSNNSISGNAIANNAQGIWIWNASANTITENDITNNDQSNIHIGSSTNNAIFGNNITLASYGVSVGTESLDNKFFLNNFIGNGEHVHVETPGQISTWDNGYPSGGNYWSDYTGIDVKRGSYQNETGSDGIGDIPEIIDADNLDNYPLIKPYRGLHDIGVTDISPSKTVVGQGYCMNISIRIVNFSGQPEVFNAMIQAEVTTIHNQTIALADRDSITVTFSWNTSGFAKGNYTVRAYAEPVLGETDTLDNNCTSSHSVTVALAADITGASGAPDHKVDMRDIGVLCLKFMTTPSSPTWTPNSDVNDDGVVDTRDIGIACTNFGQKW
jgi:parallel beta-helix repeat protein